MSWATAHASELACRARVRKRDVRGGPRTAEGAKAWDTGMPIGETAKKLGVSFYRDTHAPDAGGGAQRELSVTGHLGLQLWGATTTYLLGNANVAGDTGVGSGP